MALTKNIFAVLSIAAALLLEACNETGSAPEPEANTSTPSLIPHQKDHEKNIPE